MNWQLWLEILIRSTVLLATGELLRRLSPASKPAFRHRLLLCVLALLVLLPVFAVVLPDIPIPIWKPAHDWKAEVTVAEISTRTLPIASKRGIVWAPLVWLLGALASCVPLIYSAFCISRIASRAAGFRNELFRQEALRIAGRIPVLLSTELRVPLTSGLFRSKILLPMSAEEWPLSRLEAVLRHELAHIRRRDLVAQIGAHIISALWWFQPLVWLTSRKLRIESEFACDLEAVRSGVRASDYATELLCVAKLCAVRWSFSSSAVGMVRSAHLEQRLRAVLEPVPQLGFRGRFLVVGIALATASVLTATASVSFGDGSNDVGESRMKRTILSALLTSAGLSAAMVSGTVHDANGASVDDARVSMTNADHSAKQDAVTGSDGRFSFDKADAGQYVLRIEKPGMATLFRVFELKTDATVARDFTLSREGMPMASEAPISPDESQTKPIRVGGQVAQSNLLTKVVPVYPVAAKEAGVQGTVQISATISKEGIPVDLQIVSSPGDDLSESALDAVRQWRYRPTLLNGAPVEIVTEVIVNYTLQR